MPEDTPRPDPGLRRALALTSLCRDALETDPGSGDEEDTRLPATPNRRAPLLTVLAHEALAEASGYEQGAAVLGGARVGPDTIDLILCQGRIENVTVAGQKVTTHRSISGIRPALRRAVLARDDRCTIAGCRSTYRLEVHHILERSKGGDDSPENLTTVCWWHHHVAIHRQGMRIDPTYAACYPPAGPAATGRRTPMPSLSYRPARTGPALTNLANAVALPSGPYPSRHPVQTGASEQHRAVLLWFRTTGETLGGVYWGAR